MESKIMQVFYGNDCLPYKDQARQVKYPVIGEAFLGASDTTKVRFYFDKIGDTETTWVAVSKLPNGKVGSKVLTISYDSELKENYAELSLSSWFTQCKGELLISLQGYIGGIEYEYDDETELYSIEGTPIIQATGLVKVVINQANQILDGNNEVDDTLQTIYALLNTQDALNEGVYVVDEIDPLAEEIPTNNKILQVYYGKDCLPYKDIAREVHFPVVGGAFMGASNTTEIRFYFDKIGNANFTWVAVAKLPNGKIGSVVLNTYRDSKADENYAKLQLTSWFTQAKGDVYISLQGYEGGVQVVENDGLYEIEGNPIIQATGSIKVNILYATQIVGSDEIDVITLQEIYAEFGNKLDTTSGIIVSTYNNVYNNIGSYSDGQYVWATDRNALYQVSNGDLELAYQSYSQSDANNTFVDKTTQQTIIGNKLFNVMQFYVGDIGDTVADQNIDGQSVEGDKVLVNKEYVDRKDTALYNRIQSESGEFTQHITDYSNPHIVTKQQVGLGNVDNVQQIPLSQRGSANGVATLDNTGKIPASQIPESVLGQVEYQGSWNASSNTDQTTGIDKKGDYYICQTKGRYNPDGTDSGTANYYEVGDWAIIESINPIVWEKIDNTDSVISVNGKQGTVVLTKGDIGLGNVDNTSDLDKPISTATQNALDLKANASALNNYTTTTDLNNLLAAKQDSLTAGSNVSISAQNVISATDTTYSAGTGLTLNDTTFAIDDTVVATETDIATLYNDATFSTSGDNANITFTQYNTQTKQVNIPLANTDDAGLMSPSDVNAIATLNTKVSNLEQIGVRLLYTDSANPSAQDILDFVVASGYTDQTTYDKITVKVQATDHIWYWYSNLQAFVDEGKATIDQFTNSSLGSIQGSTDLGKVYAESDGTGSLNGYDKLNNNVAPQYSSSNTYSVGDLVIYQGDLYKCTTAITIAESWDSTHWTQTNLANDAGTKVNSIAYDDINTALTGISIGNTQYKLIPFTTDGGDMGIGYNATANGTFSTAIGYSSSSTNSGTTAIGYVASASGMFSIALGQGSTAKITDTLSIDSQGRKRTYLAYTLNNIFFKYDTFMNASSLSDYTTGFTLNERLNGLTKTDDSIRELDYDKISVIGLTANATFTLKTAPTSTGSGFSCKPTYKAIITNNANSTITITINTTTDLITNDTTLNYSVSSDYTTFNLVSNRTVHIEVFDGTVKVIRPDLSLGASKLMIYKGIGASSSNRTYFPNNTIHTSVDLNDYGARYNLGKFDTVNGNTITRKTGYLYLKNCTVEKTSNNRFQVYPKLKDSPAYNNDATPNMFISRTFEPDTPLNIANNVSENTITINDNRWILIFVSALYYSSHTAEQFLNDYGDVVIQYELETAYTETIIDEQPLNTLDLNGIAWLINEYNKSKNLCNVGWVEGSYNGTTGVFQPTSPSGYYASAGHIKVKSGTTYTIYASSSSTKLYIFYYDGTGAFQGYLNAENIRTFTTPSNVYEIAFNTETSGQATSDVMLVEGSVALPYQPCTDDILLWNNYSPDVDFGEQTLTLSNYSNYKYLVIGWRLTRYGRTGTQYFKVKVDTRYNYNGRYLSFVDETHKPYQRAFELTSATQLKVYNAYYNTNVENSCLIPTEIWATNHL